jgi:hypothetical protein
MSLQKISLALVLLTFVSASSVFSQNNPPEGYKSLFNGTNLTGWYGRAHVHPDEYNAMDEETRKQKIADDMISVKEDWVVHNGVLANRGKGLYLTTNDEFSDFELQIEYSTVPLADSGIYLKATPQVQIWDSTKEGGKWSIGADKGSGGLWNNSPGAEGKDPLVLADRKFEQWNKFVIRQVGARTSVWLNDRLVVNHAIMENYWDRSKPLFQKGPIQLQTHGGLILWRNIFVKEYSADEANAILAEANNEGFESVFNGKDFSGWKGAVENYEIVDGVIRCKESKGGTLFTEKEYGDFVARVEFKLPAGGNNGLAIRYPGTGDPAYSGMCELQVLDNTHEKYKSIDPRQAHGSAYGMVPAHQGFLRPIGQWNFQEVTVQGSKIKVELNGSVILDCDLSEVKEFMNDSEHPGLNLEKGHFGFAGHNDPVEFRNVQIKTLDK